MVWLLFDVGCIMCSVDDIDRFDCDLFLLVVDVLLGVYLLDFLYC